MFYIVVWTVIFGTIALLAIRSRKGRSWWRILRYSKKVKVFSVVIPLLIVALSVASILIPTAPQKKYDANEVFLEYSANKVADLLKNGDFILERDVFADKISPELVYILPTILKIYSKEVDKPTTPRLEQIKDTLSISFIGYRQFKNRGIRILKKVKKSLGKRYLATLTSKGSQHKLQIVYLGLPWDEEQLCSLPVMEASIKHNIDPALLMSLIHHVSDFQMNYEKDPNHKGFLALESGFGIEQIFVGAEMLRKAMDAAVPLEETLVKFYPLNLTSTANKDWHKDPMRRSWVEQVLGEVQFYSNNGLNLNTGNLKSGGRSRLPAILQPLVPIVGAQAASKIVELPPDSQVAILTEEMEDFDLAPDAGEDDEDDIDLPPVEISKSIAEEPAQPSSSSAESFPNKEGPAVTKSSAAVEPNSTAKQNPAIELSPASETESSNEPRTQNSGAAATPEAVPANPE